MSALAVLLVFGAYGFMAVSGRVVSDPPVPASVTLYYETLCPGCQSVIPGQLLPAYKDEKFRPLFKELNFVPFGNARVLNASAHEYSCQHGKVECQGNRLHACAFEYIKDTLEFLEYVSCLEKLETDFFHGYPLDKCLDKVPNELYSNILNCYNSDQSWDLLGAHAEKTNAFFASGSQFVPYVSFNGVKDDKLAEDALENFKKVLCKVTGCSTS